MLASEGRPYSQKNLLDGLLDARVLWDAIKVLGVRERNVEWEITMKSTPDRNRLLQLPTTSSRATMR